VLLFTQEGWGAQRRDHAHPLETGVGVPRGRSSMTATVPDGRDPDAVLVIYRRRPPHATGASRTTPLSRGAPGVGGGVRGRKAKGSVPSSRPWLNSMISG